MYLVRITDATKNVIIPVYKKNTFVFFVVTLLRKKRQKIKGNVSVK